jgi:hypothetical protein
MACAVPKRTPVREREKERKREKKSEKERKRVKEQTERKSQNSFVFFFSSEFFCSFSSLSLCALSDALLKEQTP